MTVPALPASEAELAARVIEPEDFVADTEAFVDVRIERSKGKASYSFVGPGVSQNADQHISIAEPHGFNVGAATMPHGVYNNAHLHYTPEVFICYPGELADRHRPGPGARCPIGGQRHLLGADLGIPRLREHRS